MNDGKNMDCAEIVTIGTEMLLGDLVDTNTAWISQRLAELGVGIYRHTTVGDNPDRIVEALREASSRSALVVTTGGLGPTSDDLTNACLSTLTGRGMVEYPEARNHVDEMFAKFGREPTANNYKQALFPEGTKLIPNPVGTAMGALVEWEGTLFTTLPGVPTEMKSMFEETLEPLIRGRSQGSIVSKTLHFAGIGESALAEKVQDFLDATDPTVAPLAGQGRVRLRITTRAGTEEEARDKISPVQEEIVSRLSDYYFGEGDETLEGAVARLLSKRGATLALAESCTGGMLAKRLTDMPGSSK
ncbi:MAG: CinA family nicotinamide mononucleotide deamidase-related protein, partial [Rubrobacter sp.]